MASGDFLGKCCIMFCVGLFVVILGAMGGIGIHYAVENMDDTCQEEDSIGLTMTEWLLGESIAIMLTIALIAGGAYGASKGEDAAFASGCCVYMALLIFHMVYTFILGTIILIRSSSECVQEGNPAAITSIVYIVLIFVSLCCGSGSAGG